MARRTKLQAIEDGKEKECRKSSVCRNKDTLIFGSGLAARRYDDDKPRDERRKRAVALVKRSAVRGLQATRGCLFKFEEERGRISQRTCGLDALLVCEIAFRPDGEAAAAPAAAAAGRAWDGNLQARGPSNTVVSNASSFSGPPTQFDVVMVARLGSSPAPLNTHIPPKSVPDPRGEVWQTKLRASLPPSL